MTGRACGTFGRVASGDIRNPFGPVTARPRDFPVARCTASRIAHLSCFRGTGSGSYCLTDPIGYDYTQTYTGGLDQRHPLFWEEQDMPRWHCVHGELTAPFREIGRITK
jgi:hypothetical protein